MDNSEAVEKLTALLLPQIDCGYEREAAEHILAAIQADPLAYVKVKPLEWENREPVTITLQAIGRRPYKIFTVEDGFALELGMLSLGVHPTLEAAQAAAYDDLCKRVKELF